MQLPPGRLRLAGKVAIVTGAGSSGPGVGTGKATSILFAREGAKVLLVDREVAAAEETLAEIEAEGGAASVFQADVTKAHLTARHWPTQQWNAMARCTSFSTTWASAAPAPLPPWRRRSGTGCWT